MLSGLVFAQKTTALKVGDRMPAYIFPSFVNLNQKLIDTKIFRGKYLLLDFWSTGCSSCIDAFPHTQEMQNRLKDNLQIILVNDWKGDSRSAVLRTIERIEKRTGLKISMPSTIYDKKLDDYFPHKVEGLQVILNTEGKIIAITGPESITEDNLKKLIKGEKIDFPIRDDFWDWNAPFVANKIVNPTKNILVNSSLTGYSPIARYGSKRDKNGVNFGQTLTNYALIDLYREAYIEFFKTEPTLIYNTNDSIIKQVDVLKDHTKAFSYDVQFQPGKFSMEKYRSSLQKDLDLLFKFSFKKTRQILPCLIIRTNPKVNSSYTTHDKWENNLGYIKEATANGVTIYSYKTSSWSISYLFWNLTGSLKIIDETTDKHDLDIEFPKNFDFTNFEKIKSFLHEKGIDLTVENRELDCIIVSDKKPGEPTILN